MSQDIEKAAVAGNPYHDARGRFAAHSSSGGSHDREDPATGFAYGTVASTRQHNVPGINPRVVVHPNVVGLHGTYAPDGGQYVAGYWGTLFHVAQDGKRTRVLGMDGRVVHRLAPPHLLPQADRPAGSTSAAAASAPPQPQTTQSQATSAAQGQPDTPAPASIGPRYGRVASSPQYNPAGVHPNLILHPTVRAFHGTDSRHGGRYESSRWGVLNHVDHGGRVTRVVSATGQVVNQRLAPPGAAAAAPASHAPAATPQPAAAPASSSANIGHPVHGGHYELSPYGYAVHVDSSGERRLVLNPHGGDDQHAATHGIPDNVPYQPYTGNISEDLRPANQTDPRDLRQARLARGSATSTPTPAPR